MKIKGYDGTLAYTQIPNLDKPEPNKIDERLIFQSSQSLQSFSFYPYQSIIKLLPKNTRISEFRRLRNQTNQHVVRLDVVQVSLSDFE
jgi:hypothetical protein